MERRLIIGLSAALGIALLAIAFLLGRRSSEPAAPPLAPGSSSGVVTPAAAPADPGVPPVPAASTEPPAATVAPGSGSTAELPAAPAAAPDAAPAAPATSLAGDDTLIRPEVVRYFAQVDAIQAEAKTAAGDPEALAQLILKHAADGDMTELDTLLRTQRGLANRLRAVIPPPPCADHLRKAVSAVDDGIAILQTTRDALAGRDFGSLTSLTSSGQDLERRAREVDAIGAALKKRFAL